MPDDKDLISSETHELNYVLKKWDKKQNKKNRQILRDTLVKFRDDKTYKPHNRQSFYRYVDEYNIRDLLEDADKKKSTKKKAGKQSIMPDINGNDLTVDDPYIHKSKKSKKQKVSIQDLTIQRNTQLTEMKIDKKGGAGPGEKTSRKNLIIALIIVLVIIFIIILILVGTCLYNNAQNQEQNSASTENETEQVPIEEEITGETAETKEISFTSSTLISFLETCTPLYFKGDLDKLLPGEELKIDSLALYLDNYTLVELSIQGHTADMGKPEDELDLSIKRAGLVADLLEKKVKKAELKLKTTGYGAEKEAVTNPDKKTRKLNRRVEIKVGKVIAE